MFHCTSSLLRWLQTQKVRLDLSETKRSQNNGIPRRKGDVKDPSGGIRGVIPEKRTYP